MLRAEAESLEVLLGKRNTWLMRKENQCRSTFRTVKADTMELAFRLEELKGEIEILAKVVETEKTKSDETAEGSVN